MIRSGAIMRACLVICEGPQEQANSFVDVYESDYYYDADLWAKANGVTNGTSATMFSPDVVVFRAQAMTFLYRE